MEKSHQVGATTVQKILTVCLVKIRRSRWMQSRWPISGRVLGFGNKIIKISTTADLNEAQTLQFLATNTSIPAPKLHWAFINRGKTYTVMSKIPGHSLCDIWHTLSRGSQDEILAQLKAIVTKMRSTNRPPGLQGVRGTVGGPINDSRLPGETLKGPFDNLCDFHQALVEGNDLDQETTLPEVRDLFAFYRDAKHNLVLTHGDLSSLNIIVHHGKITGIIDWETAGWYPSYWEYTTAKAVNPYNEFWEAEIDRFLDPLPRELAMDKIRLRYFNWYGADMD